MFNYMDLGMVSYVKKTDEYLANCSLGLSGVA